jgi:hypothetical protein
MVTPTVMELRRHGDSVSNPVERARRTTTRQTPGTNPQKPAAFRRLVYGSPTYPDRNSVAILEPSPDRDQRKTHGP